MSIRYILTDIEGTTTSVSFVYEVLFPYFEQNIPFFLAQNADNSVIQECLLEIKTTITKEEKRSLTTTDDILEVLLTWVKQDRKHTALKTLQGLLWEIGYHKGEIKGHIYADVLPALKQWKEQGIQMGIYSSGSVKAQKLLFSTSILGDLTLFFSHYFDTLIGNKRQPESYYNIQNILEIPPQEILFLSDIPEELSAARASHFQTIQLVREGTQASPLFIQAQDFEQVHQIIQEQTL